MVEYRIPDTAPATMAEGEFNIFYCRGLCARAVADGAARLIVYRAKEVMTPRPDSQAKIGAAVNPSSVLADLRQTHGIEPSLGLPPGPNTGLSLKLPD